MEQLLLERRLAAVLAADVAGYTRLMGVDEQGTHERYMAHCRDAIRPKVAQYHGRIVKSTGDGFLAEFASVVEAISCAVDVQQALAMRNAKEPLERRMHFRIGINIGDVIVENDDIYGDGVNVAARLEGLAEPGGICISDVVRAAAGNKMPVDYEFIGDEHLKNITEPVRVYRVRPRAGVAMPPPSSPSKLRKPTAAALSAQISVSRMPVTGGLLLGRDEELRILDDAWNKPYRNIVSLVAWGGVGKSTLINHWVRRMAHDGYRGADKVYAWSFYHQGTVDRVVAADEFIGSALAWFGDTSPNKGSTREKGERLAKLVQKTRTLLILDGLEPLQRPPGPKEGTLVDDGLHALICDLASLNPGLAVITTRYPITDLQDFHDTHTQINVNCLTPRDGANLLRAHKIKGGDGDLEEASREFGGHCLALTLLASYLNDAYQGDISCRCHVAALQRDIRYGDHARRVLSSYAEWIENVAEREILRIIGLFDRPAAPSAIQALMVAAIPNLTDEISRLTNHELNRLVSRLRRVGLLTQQDPNSPDSLDAHPLVRHFFREKLQSEFTLAWKKGNECLFRHFQSEGKAYPENLVEMDALFQSVVFGCHAGLHQRALHEVYLPRIMRHQTFYAANVLGARGTLLSVLSHFFESRSWDHLVEPGPEQEGLEPQDQLTVLQHVRMLLTATMGYNTHGAIQCYQRMKSLCDRLGETRSLYSVLTSEWMHSLVGEKLPLTMFRADEILTLAQQQSDNSMMIGAYRCLSDTAYFMGEFHRAKTYAESGIALWEAGATTMVEEVSAPVVTCISFLSLTLWQHGNPKEAIQQIEKAAKVARAMAHAHSLAVALHFDGYVSHFCGQPTRTEEVALQLIDISQQNAFQFWLAGAHVQLGWARTLLGSTDEGLSLIAQGIKEWRATNAELIVPYWLAMSAEAHAAAGRGGECMAMIDAACTSADGRGELWWKSDLLRLKGLCLVEQGDSAQGELYLQHALELARRQASLSLQLRAVIEIGRLRLKSGRIEDAHQLIKPVYEAINRDYETNDLKSASAILSIDQRSPG